MAEIRSKIRLRKDTEANWISVNPVLLDGEVAVVVIAATETSSSKIRFKVGNGITVFSELEYIDEADGSVTIDENNILCKDGVPVQELGLAGKLKVAWVSEIPAETSISNVMVQNTSTGEIQKRNINQLLKDAGGFGKLTLTNDGVLGFEVGK